MSFACPACLSPPPSPMPYSITVSPALPLPVRSVKGLPLGRASPSRLFALAKRAGVEIHDPRHVFILHVDRHLPIREDSIATWEQAQS
jgi:hypothetical protein